MTLSGLAEHDWWLGASPGSGLFQRQFGCRFHYTCAVRREFSLLKTAEGACAILNGGLNAQAKGLATALQRLLSQGVPYWREAAFQGSPPKEQTCIAG